MFSFFKEVPSQSDVRVYKQAKDKSLPLVKLFQCISTNQKYSILNLLHLTANIEGIKKEKLDAMFWGINFYVSILEVRAADAMAYFRLHGVPRIISDLNALSHTLKEVLVLMGHDYITLDGRPTVNELTFMGNLFSEIGIGSDQYIAIIQKSKAIKDFLALDGVTIEAFGQVNGSTIPKKWVTPTKEQLIAAAKLVE